MAVRSASLFFYQLVNVTIEYGDLRVVEPAKSIAALSQRNHTWLPILGGVMGGMVVWLVFSMLESPSFYRLTVWIFKETSPKLLFAIPAYYCVHRTLLLMLAAIGGAFGMAFSKWSYSKCILFLSRALIVIAIFAALGFH